MNHGDIQTSERVRDALAEGRPVVALETAVITHGMPRAPLPTPACFAEDSPLHEHLGHVFTWDETDLANRQLGLMMSRMVEAMGAIPASVAVIDGVLRIGLDEQEMGRLAEDEGARKASTRDLGPLLGSSHNGGTTVAATLRACQLAQPHPIRVFATGGIGGVHRDWQKRPDVSADLRALGMEPVAVVCSGAKVILDLTATLEVLDSLGVPVIGYRTEFLPRFTASPGDVLPVSQTAETPEAVAMMCDNHWNKIGSKTAFLVTNPCPSGLEADHERLDKLVQTSLAEAAALGIEGGEVTPFLLGSMGQDEEASTISANMSLLLGNARLASQVAKAIENDLAKQD